jgi:hypothetical protein
MAKGERVMGASLQNNLLICGSFAFIFVILPLFLFGLHHKNQRVWAIARAISTIILIIIAIGSGLSGYWYPTFSIIILLCLIYGRQRIWR